MSLRKKMSQLLPEIIQTDDIKNYKGKTLNNYNYRTNYLINSKIKNKSLATPSINTEINYYIDKIKITPKRNFGYNTEKTECSSQINERTSKSKITGNSEIKPLFTNIKFNDSVSPIYKTETQNFYRSEQNIFNTKTTNKKAYKNNRINIYPKKYNYNNNSNKSSSCWYAKIDELNNISKFNMEKIIKFSNNFLNSKTPKIKKRKKYIIINNSKDKNKNSKNHNRFNSLNCFIDNYIEFDENKILNRYNPKFDEYFGKLDYYKLIQKGKNLLTAKEKIKTVFKDTKLLMAMCDYLNTSLAKLKNEKRAKIKNRNKQIEEMKKNTIYQKTFETNLRNNLVEKKDLFKMNTINNKNSFIKKPPILYKNGCFSKYFYFPTSLSCNYLD